MKSKPVKAEEALKLGLDQWCPQSLLAAAMALAGTRRRAPRAMAFTARTRRPDAALKAILAGAGAARSVRA